MPIRLPKVTGTMSAELALLPYYLQSLNYTELEPLHRLDQRLFRARQLFDADYSLSLVSPSLSRHRYRSVMGSVVAPLMFDATHVESSIKTISPVPTFCTCPTGQNVIGCCFFLNNLLVWIKALLYSTILLYSHKRRLLIFFPATGTIFLSGTTSGIMHCLFREC